MKKFTFFAIACVLFASSLPVMAGSVTLNWGSNAPLTVDGLDDDLVNLINDHKSEIESALAAGGVDSTTAQSYVKQAQDAYDTYAGSIKNPYTTAVNGLDDFTDILLDTIPNSQIQQNVWANAWIGSLVPGLNFGFGINAGVSKLDTKPLATIAKAFGLKDAGNIPNTLVWPTVTADLRVGGFILPFDVGFTAMTLDSTKIGALDNAIQPAFFDMFMIGGDIRYAILKGGILRPKLSVGAGVYYTKGEFGVEDSGTRAELDFSSTSLVLSTQASIKLLFFVPFAGARLMFSKTDVDWKVKANWASILNTSNSSIADALSYGILPSKFSGGSSSNFGNHVRPVIFGGFAFDFTVVDLTLSASYDFVSKIPAGALSLRFALN